MTRNFYLPLIAVGSLAIGAAFSPGSRALSGESTEDPKPKAASKVTYADQVATILNRSCVSCHHDGAVAPFSLVGYDNAKKWASNLAAVVEAGAMPPWKAAPNYGEFLDDPRLSAAEIDVLQKWHEAGAPRGDKRKEPKEPVFNSEWVLGEPDLILKPEKAYKLDAEGADVYRNFVFKTNFDKPTWVRAVDVKPGNPKVVHHEITFLDGSGAAKKLEEANKDGQLGYSTSGGGVGFMPSGSLGGWAPGISPREMPPGYGFLVKPGSTVVMQVHYHKTGKPEEDLTKLGIYFSKGPIKKQMMLDWVFNFGIKIPAGEKLHKEIAQDRIDDDITLYSVMPHMHLLGRSMKAHVEFPDGTTKPLIWVDDWDFNWQLAYVLKEPMKVPKGSKIKVDAVYDNSVSNPRNPHNPPKEVTWGEQTTDEMFLLIAAYTLDNHDVSEKQ
jgi:mono/diheme cytochrome c family protein